tara:strand:- start:92 stop:304 length:213 start_codon:yes stop_codon:yes gene_type:complete
MKMKELRELQTVDLEKRLVELRMDLMKDNAQIATGTTLKSPAHARNTKKNIARLHLLLHERKTKEDGSKE